MAMSSEGKNESSLKVSTDEPEAFTESGRCDDEITLVFDEDKKLYASKNFLRYASPVFEAMFTFGWKEGKENCVELKGKQYDDFLEFLLCIHPRVFKPVTEKNVLQIVMIAEEYQVTTIIKKCQETMLSCLSDSLLQAKTSGQRYYHKHVEFLRFCLRIVATAHALCYNNVVNSSVKTIAKFGHNLYNKEHPVNFKCYPYSSSLLRKIGNETAESVQNHCIDLFNELPVEVRYQILSERLLLMTDVDLKV